ILFTLQTQKGAPHRVALVRLARHIVILVPGCEGGSERAAGVTRSRLNPDVAVRSFPHDSSISNAVERDPSSHAQELNSQLTMNPSCESEHHFFGHLLHRGGNVHLALGE